MPYLWQALVNDWCLIADDNSAAICRRIEKGSVKKCGKAGWLHILGDFNPKKHNLPEKPYIDWAKHTTEFAQALSSHREEYAGLCRDARINPISALRFNIGYCKGWLTIPLYGMDSKITGIQRRQKNIKRFMKWSDLGVFIPSAFYQHRSKTLAVTEGFTDCVAAYSYGFSACIGRVNCYCGDEEVLAHAKRLGCERAIVFADNDDVGRDGAEECGNLLRNNNIRTKVCVTPEKDLNLSWNKGIKLREVLDYGQ